MNIALILSGGNGSRVMQDTPKQYLEICGRTMIEYSLLAFAENKNIEAIQIVAGIVWQETIKKCMNRTGENRKFMGFSVPGVNRQMSILNGLEDIRQFAPPDAAVIIHDAARPGISQELIERSLIALPGHDGVLPVLPMKDTVYYSTSGEKVDWLLKRECVYAGQAPETFRLEPYLEANRALLPEKILRINGSTEPAVLAGLDVIMIPGEECNFKITTKADIRRFEQEWDVGI